MEDLENINIYYKENYYDKETWDEDSPFEKIPIEVHKKFENLENIFNEICDGINIENAMSKSLEGRKNLPISNNFIYGEIVIIINYH